MQNQNNLNHNLLGDGYDPPDRQLDDKTPEGQKPAPSSALFNQVIGRIAANQEPQEQKSSLLREIHVSLTRWSGFKLFITNCIETLLICMGLVLSIYKDDIISFGFQILMQILLFLSMKKMGQNIPIQRKISLATLALIGVSLIVKWFLMNYMEADLTTNRDDQSQTMLTFGFKFNVDKDTGNVSFDRWKSVEFEFLATTLNILLQYYYHSQNQRKLYSLPIGYVHHSQWLSQYMTLYFAFFFFLAIDTFFAQTMIQFTVLVLMISIMYLWAYDYSHKNRVIRFVVVWSQRLYTLQLAFLAFTQIAIISVEIAKVPLLYDIFFVAGLILKEKPYYASISHVFIMCAVLGFGQLYETCYQNYLLHQHQQGDNIRAAGLKSLTQNLLAKQEESQAQSKRIMHMIVAQGANRQNTNQSGASAMFKAPSHPEKKSMFGFRKLKQFNYKEFIEKYAPYVYIWVCRICCVVLAYFYHGEVGFLLLTWTLLSFMISLVTFVYYTIIFVTPLITLAFMFFYFINIPGLFLNKDESQDGSTDQLYTYGLKFVNPPLEMGFMIFTLTFFLLLIPTRYILRLQRDEFRTSLFKHLSDKRSNFLFQLSFYVLKRLHVFALLFIFIFQMKELNVYYVGLMFFFIMFASSLNTYRKYGKWLVFYAALFIWLIYLWSLISVYFDSNGIVYKTFLMIIFTYQTPETVETGVNQYFTFNIPISQWLTLFLFVFLTNINYCFRYDKKIVKNAPDGKKQKQEYASTADFYEAKNDYVLRKKFPSTAKIINMFSLIISEMMIIFILIAQGLILVFQPPTLFFWGFLIFSLSLQTSIVSSLETSASLYKRCALQSRILKYYSMTIIIAQVAYYFITDPNFLAQDDELQSSLGDTSKYLELIGLQKQNGSQSPVGTFISQIAFYIMAVILEDYFIERLKILQEDEVDEFTIQNSPTRRQSSPNKKQMEAIEEESEHEDESEQVLYEYEKIRFRITYMIYQKMSWWKIIDSITLNFYLVTAAVTVINCTLWQVSLFMSFYLICAVVLCIKAASALHHNGQHMIEERSELDLNQAHQVNREYMFKANQTLLRVRSAQWNYQYWLLILSMIIIYPTQTLPIFKETLLPQYSQQFDKAIFWLFWSGLMVVETSVEQIAHHIPLYTILLVLILEKLAQKWQKNRFGCTLDRIIEYKTLDEQVALIKTKQHPHELNEDTIIPIVNSLGEFTTIGEARQACERVSSLYHFQTEEIKDKRIKDTLILELKRKYTIQYRNAQKIIIEQISLLLLLLSCAYKANVISIAYLIILFTFLRIKNKTTGMLIMTYTFGFILALEYTISLTNLTSMSSPREFPEQYNPYPSLANSEGEFIFPWYTKIDFLRNNIEWTIFLSIDVEKGAVNDMWFDFVNLVVLTIYFFSYGNPINSKNIKVSFSQTRSLENNLNDYAKSQMKRKSLKKRNKHTITEEQEGEESDGSETFSKQAADDSHEYFLGATHYLDELKKKIFLYYFTKNARYTIFIGSQIVTVTLIFVLAFLCKSLMSLGYMIACVPLIINITDFFHLEQLHQEGRRWSHPHYICGPLMIYSFVDIALQICFQIPNQEGSQLQDWLGFHKIYKFAAVPSYSYMIANNGSLAQVNQGNLNFLILKCFNLFVIFLQSRIFQSEGFAKFTRIDRRNLLNLALKEKKLAITYRFNNWKLQKIAALQHNKKEMFKNVVELKSRIKWFRSLILGPGDNQFESPKHENKPNISIHATQESSLLEKNQEQTQNEQTEPTQKASQKKVGFEISIEKTIKQQFIKDVIEKDDKYLEKKELLKHQISKLPYFARKYIHLKRKYINQVLFITDLEEAQLLRKEMQSGKRTIFCDLEKLMMQDINLFYLQQKSIIPTRTAFKKGQKKDENKVPKLKLADMEKTQRFILAKNLFISVISVIMETIFCNCSFIAYFFMIMSQITSAGLITLAYPLAVFGYALMEEQRPPKYFWNIMLKYTLFILFMKFAFQLDIWLVVFESQLEAIQFYNEWILFGLWRVESISLLFLYIVPEVLILLAIMGQCYFETLIGLHNKREIEVESIQEAKDRYLESLKGEFNPLRQTIKHKKDKLSKLNEEHEFEDNQENYEQRAALYPAEISSQLFTYEAGISRDLEDNLNENPISIKRKSQFQNELQDYLPERRYSFIENKTERVTVSKSLKQERKKNQEVPFVKRHFGKKDYFKRLFPIIKEQKPGHDLYAWTTFVQFVICIYLLNWYTLMDAVGIQNLENSSQFSFQMVMVLFFQVGIMIIERYVNRTNIRVKVKKIGSQKNQNDGDFERGDSFNQQTTAPRSLSIHVNQVTSSDTLMLQKAASEAIMNINTEQPDVTLSQTRITLQQVSKWLVQWSLLIIYHIAVFWYFPLISNFSIYGTPTCNPDSRSFAKYACFSFHQNSTLIIFYLIFCLYFTFSALQIQFGLPDFRRGSILMEKHDTKHQLSYLVFYQIPFLMELKTILDWCFTKTALDVNQWLELVHINTELFFSKCANQSYFQRKLGTVITKFEKYLCGCFCLGVILFFLLGPFLMFSNLSIIAQSNLVTGVDTNFLIRIQNADTNENFEFPLFQTTSPIYIQPMNQSEFENKQYNIFPETKFFEYTQAQVIKLKNSSETEWSLSGDSKEVYNQLIDLASLGHESITIELVLDLSFSRPGPILAKTASQQIVRTLKTTDPKDRILIEEFDNATNLNCVQNPLATQEITIAQFLSTYIRLTEQTEVQSLINEEDLPRSDINLTYSCGNFWSMNIDEERITLITFSDLISSGFLSATSIMGFYLGVAYLVGTALRKIVVYNSDRIFICDMPDSGALLNLCNYIYLQRLEQNCRKEEEHYFVLIECLRSPEMLKAIAGSSLRAKI